MASIRLLRQTAEDASNKNEKAHKAYLNEYDANYRPAFDNYKGQVENYNKKVSAYNAEIGRKMKVGSLYEGVDGKLYRATKNGPALEGGGTGIYKAEDGKYYKPNPLNNFDIDNTNRMQATNNALGFGQGAVKKELPPIPVNVRAANMAPGEGPTAPKAPNDPLIIDPKFTSAEQRKLREGGGLTMAQQQQLVNKGYQPKSDLAGDDAPTRNSAFYSKEDALKDMGILTRTLAGQLGKF